MSTSAEAPHAHRAHLVSLATEARQNAYAPYSRFQVGAAVLAADGRTFVGANVENCAFGSTICAERHAVGAAVVAGARALTAVAVVVDYDHLVTPCGACRQVLAEFGLAWVLLHNLRDGEGAWRPLASLLPDGPALAALAERADDPPHGQAGAGRVSA